ncbi:HTH domain-containing protein [Candidatus Uhrbacteria bacterium]|nr:HTH domain-containing protein [Candidatus Uhrbacteria bacterium]MBT7717195.1 HTH domain-containing protein [Candidatus Uhrbacteria bacterium]
MKKELRAYLQELGLSNKEIDIYIAVLGYGKISATHLSKLTNIHRTTIYSSIQNLINMGFIIEELGGSKRYFLPNSPESLSNIYKVEQESLQKKKTTVNAVIQAAKDLLNDAIYSPPKIRFIPEEQVEKFLYEQTPVWIESIVKTNRAWWGFQDHIFAELFEPWIDWFWEQAPERLGLKLLSNKSDIEESIRDKPFPRRQIRYWDGDDFTATVWVIGEYIVTLSLQEHPYHIVQTYDPVLAENFANVFKRLWSTNQ